MKLRSRKIDADEASTSTAKMAKIESYESIFPGMLVSYGEHGKCDGSECDGMPIETWPIEGRNLCEVCATKEYGSDFEQIEEDHIDPETSDAKFKCPAYDLEGSCKSKEVHIVKFFMGTCCEPASKVFLENEKAQEKQLKVVHELYKWDFNSLQHTKEYLKNTPIRIKKTEDIIKQEEEALEQMMKKVEEAKKSLEDRKWYLRCNKRGYEDSKKRIIEEEKEKNESLKRFKQLSYEYHPVAAKLSIDEDVEAKENRKDYQYCKACDEFYNDTDRRKSFLPSCGHVACLKCFKDKFKVAVDYSYCPFTRAKDCTEKYNHFQIESLNE